MQGRTMREVLGVWRCLWYGKGRAGPTGRLYATSTRQSPAGPGPNQASVTGSHIYMPSHAHMHPPTHHARMHPHHAHMPPTMHTSPPPPCTHAPPHHAHMPPPHHAHMHAAPPPPRSEMLLFPTSPPTSPPTSQQPETMSHTQHTGHTHALTSIPGTHMPPQASRAYTCPH